MSKIKKLPNCKDTSENLKSYHINFKYSTIRGNTKAITVESKGIDPGAAGANLLLWLVITQEINKEHFKMKDVNLVSIQEISSPL